MCKMANKEPDETNKPEYIVYENEHTLAYISPKWWKNNPGHVLVIPKQHTENIYTISDELHGEVYKTAKKIALALKIAYQCDGTSTRQHNEPAGNQGVWHLHVHVFPRYENDELYKNYDKKRWPGHDEKMQFVSKLKKYFSENS